MQKRYSQNAEIKHFSAERPALEHENANKYGLNCNFSKSFYKVILQSPEKAAIPQELNSNI